MTVEEINLLYTDLCARIPCGVAYHWKGRTGEDDMPHYLNGMNEWMIFYIQQGFVKPYLRPLSSMTEEEKIELCTISYAPDEMKTIEEKLYVIKINAKNAADFYNEHHFDYRGLIPMGLALEAPEGMYKQN